MFKHTNGSSDMMMAMLMERSGNELEVIIVQTDQTIYFTETHITDLKTVI